ncbi:hypothetical protein, partial [Oenococcus oeni]
SAGQFWHLTYQHGRLTGCWIAPWFCAIGTEVFLAWILTRALIRLLKNQSRNQNSGIKEIMVSRKMNEGLVEFLIGIAVSSTISLPFANNQFMFSLCVMILFQLLLFALFSRSTNSMPNVLLTCLGWSYVRWSEGYIFMPTKLFRENVDKKVQCTAIGDEVSGAYVIVMENKNENQ